MRIIKKAKEFMQHKNNTDHSGEEHLTVKFAGREMQLPIARQMEFLQAHSHGEASWRVYKAVAEFVRGYDFLDRFDKTVSIFGSARKGFNDDVYREAYELGYNLAKMGFAVFTGGGPGVMEAANKGAREAEGRSVGINIKLPPESRMQERKNQYIDESESFDFFFVRKVILSFAAQFYIFFPGGFGTLDELFEMLTLIQTKKTKPIPIILVNKAYWTPLLSWIEQTIYRENGAIDKEDMEIYHLVDSSEEATALIRECLRNNSGAVKRLTSE